MSLFLNKIKLAVFHCGRVQMLYDGRWSRTLKRLTFKPTSCLEPTLNNEECVICKSAFFLTKGRPFRKDFDEAELFCQWDSENNYFGEPRILPCDLDLGGPASAMDQGHSPYCMWKVFGINVNPKQTCNDSMPALYRIPGSIGLPWLEEVIWRYDMNIPSFDLRWPKCPAVQMLGNPDELIHLDKFSEDRYHD